MNSIPTAQTKWEHQSKWNNQIFVEGAERLLIPYPSIVLDDFPVFTKITGGFRAKEFSILCGGTGSGKTQILANWSASLMKQGVNHFVASVETGPHDYNYRVMSALYERDFNTGEAISLEMFQDFQRKWGHIIEKKLLRLALHENRVSVMDLIDQIRYEVEYNGAKVVFLDNMNFFMEVTRSSDAIVEMDRVIHELIIFCKSLEAHIVMIMHPRKTQDGRIESEFDIKGSSTAVQEAHNVFLWNRPPKSELDGGNRSPFERDLKIAKMRRRGKFVGAEIQMISKTGGATLVELEVWK